MTEEQDAAVEAFAEGGPLRVVAYAGAGKTTTLAAMADRAGFRRGLYLAFNKAIADDAGAKFARTRTVARTAHSLAFRAVAGWGYSDAKMRGRLGARDLQSVDLGRVAGVSPVALRQLVAGTLRRFCHSADPVPAHYHIPRLAAPVPAEIEQAIAEAVPQVAFDLWRRQVDRSDALPLGHDGYLKLFALSSPALDCDFLLLDEAQDLNPVLVGIVREQRCQVVAVGDPWQQIYAWRGAVDALKRLPGRELRLSQSFRFGSRIAALATRVISIMGETVPVRGNGRPDAVSEPDFAADATVCRTNSGVVEVAARLLRCGHDVHVPGGVAELRALVQDAQRLQRGVAAQSGELLGFTAWREVEEYAESEDGRDLRVLVGLVGEYGAEELLRVLDLVSERAVPGAAHVSTGHRAKGLEWSSVELHTDFSAHGRPGRDERRLFYVAATRAKFEVGVPAGTVDAYTRAEDD